MSSLDQVELLDVWRRLGGPEPRGRRAPAWWRESRDRNVSFDFRRNVYNDHARGEGGGVLKLVETVLNCDRTRALAWLEREGFISRRAFSPEQREAYRQRKIRASDKALDIDRWRRGRIRELNEQKLRAAAQGSDQELERVASLCNRLENGTPAEIIREFRDAADHGRTQVSQLIAVEAQWDRQARGIAAKAVAVLATLADSEG